MSKAFDRIKNGLDDIAAWKAGATTATIHFDGQSYQMTRPEHDAFRLGVAAGRLAGLNEAAEVARSIKSYDDNLQRSAGCATTGERIAAVIAALAKP